MALSDILSALRWWAVLTVFGLAVLPLSYALLWRLPDRGYAFTRMLGLLLVSFVFWLAGSLGFAANHAGGILLALAVVAAVSWLAYRRNPTDRPLSGWLSGNRRTILAAELVFGLVFAGWVWVRAQNPAIAATEKPMEFAFLNAIGRSPTFPPLDPWLSGYAISYYYFGYVMTSVLGRLALVAEPVAFNLAVAWLVAGTAVGAFGLVYNLVALAGRRTAVAWGVVAALAVAVAGNLQIGLELLHGNGIGSPALWRWIDIRDINGPADTDGSPRYGESGWWWWRTSRVIHEHYLSGRSEEGLEPIVEVPAFSFVLGDLHPHVLALPFAFLSLAVALAWYLQAQAGGAALSAAEWNAMNWAGRVRRLPGKIGLPLWLLTAVVLGGLSFLNTWDVLIHLFVVLGAFWLGAWAGAGERRGLFAQTLVIAVLMVISAVVLYLPFYLGFRSQAGPPFLLPMLLRPTRLIQFLVIFGIPLLPISVLLLVRAAGSRFRGWQAGLLAALGLTALLSVLMIFLAWIVASTNGGGSVAALASDLGVSLPPWPGDDIAPGWGIRAVAAVLPSLVVGRLAYAALLLFLLALLALAVMAIRNEVEPAAGERRAGHPALPFALLLVITGLLLAIGPEFVYLRDNFGLRLNTTFKFYYQAWVMFGIASVFSLDYLWAAVRARGGRLLPAAVTVGYALLLLVALLFPVYAVRSRSVEYRGPVADAAGTPLDRQPATLDGLAYLQRSNPAEYEAIAWLREQATTEGPTVILEAVGGQYSSFGRMSANTGLPTILGWPGHELQWRGSDNPEPGRREPLVRQIYSTADLELVAFLLDEFEVGYIVVGDLEASTYGPAGMEKFRDRLDVAFQNDRVTIYRWEPAALAQS